jgi:hypothetical protein
MHIIILAAGQSSRFKEEGYSTPKPFLLVDWRGRIQTMLEHVINTVPVQYKNITVALPEHFIRDAKNLKTRFLTYDVSKTKGPAETALKTLWSLGPDSTLIMDVDVLNFTNDLYRLSALHTSGVLVSWAANPSFSYVEKVGTFKRIMEKKRISDFAVRGAYFIPVNERKDFLFFLEETIQREPEPFISQAFASMPTAKFAIKTTYTPYDWGTPRDLKLSGAHIVTKAEMVKQEVKQDVCDPGQ